ncbi:hypothetical protein ES332_A06G105800v1 [Gossypium tomentosum]|uniref:Uncharacterized protein n=1 Tax=Gossypium tomentosum TaxID=34277 RepID=A0A5D2Q1Y7_GOSTO|nr:hypothetical protein ES332_A06G105800v1 [Gossypium tomentosum]
MGQIRPAPTQWPNAQNKLKQPKNLVTGNPSSLQRRLPPPYLRTQYRTASTRHAHLQTNKKTTANGNKKNNGIAKKGGLVFLFLFLIVRPESQQNLFIVKKTEVIYLQKNTY